MSVVPISIRPHLVPFFFNECQGKEVSYANRKVKAALFSPQFSSLGRMIRLLMVKAGRPLLVDNFNLYMSIVEEGKSKRYQGHFYKFENGRNSFLQLPPETTEDINDLMEDLFRMSFVSYVNGCIENNSEACVVLAINKFIDKYDLLECGFSNETLRRLYYRERKTNKIACRFQNKKSPNVVRFAE